MDLVQKQIINSDEFFIMLCIAKRIGKRRQSFPSRTTLMKETNFSKDKVSRSITNLCKAGILEKEQRNNGKFSSNLYTIKTNLIGVYIGAEDEELIEEETKITVTQNTDTQIPCTENKPLSINQDLEVLINSSEVKKINKKENSNLKQKFNLEIELKKPEYSNLTQEIKDKFQVWWSRKPGKRTQEAFTLAINQLLQANLNGQNWLLDKGIESEITGKGWQSLKLEWYTDYLVNQTKPANRPFAKYQTQAQKEIQNTNQISEYANF